MNFKIPKNTDKYQWTEHSIYKMKQYGLTAQRVLRVIRAPQRKEEGIVKNTVAVMQPASVSTKNGKRIWNSEIWAMYQASKAGNPKLQITNPKQELNPKLQKLQTKNYRLKIISAWRYPGVSPERDPIPPEILREIEEMA